MSLNHFAALYDLLMEDAPYEEWLQYTKKYVKSGSSVLDVACGTGTFTLLLEEEGFETSGVDISAEMLAAAEKKARDNGGQSRFYRQDMTEMTGFHALDAVTLYCDGLNYLREKEEVRAAFKQIFQSLKPGGVFLFDVHTPFKIEHVFENQLYGENAPEVSYLWFCEPGEEPLSVHHSLTFFIEQEDGRYERQEEELYQRTFPPLIYKQLLQESGFYQIEITGDFGNSPVLPEADRLFFKAVKKE